MLCVLPSQECCDVKIKAFDLRGKTSTGGVGSVAADDPAVRYQLQTPRPLRFPFSSLQQIGQWFVDEKVHLL